jgi:two-component system chemotaxis sensor kinase CheA
MPEEQKKLKKVLLVDDDLFLLNMYAVKFQKAGYEIQTVGSAEAALENLRSGSKYDAIVFDIVMPAMDGLAFAETVKKEKLSPQSVLIALTNQAQDADIERGKSIGIDGCIVKASALPSEVVREVTEVIEKKS